METTSRRYYEDKLREFQHYGRGRTLQQFCKDEGIDYRWMLRAKRQYSSKEGKKEDDESNERPSLIKLHYDDDSMVDGTGASQEEPARRVRGWTVGHVVLTDPNGNEVTISSGSAAALGGLLTRLASCHD